MTHNIYLDNNASTPLDPRVRDKMIAELSCETGNPSSIHYRGQEVRNRLIHARRTIAEVLQVPSSQIVFTSGGTEALNMTIHAALQSPGHVVTSNVEHPAVATTLEEFDNVTEIPVGLHGGVTVEAVQKALRPDTKLIVLIAANNETGVYSEIEEIAALAEERKIPFIVDGVAALGKGSFSFHPGITAACFSAHKIHGPHGVGFAVVRPSLKGRPFITGGGQEAGRRGGTENVVGIIGCAEAVRLLGEELPNAVCHMEALRGHFESSLKGVKILGEGPRVCNTSCVAFAGDGDAILMNLDLEGIAVSHGSACASGSLEPSRVLTNMGYPKEVVRGAIRFSLSHFTTKEEIDHTVDILHKLL